MTGLANRGRLSNLNLSPLHGSTCLDGRPGIARQTKSLLAVIDVVFHLE